MIHTRTHLANFKKLRIAATYRLLRNHSENLIKFGLIYVRKFNFKFVNFECT
jgi:hypothetical protein